MRSASRFSTVFGCSNVPFKWVLVQFIAFIVLCGMTHLLNVWTYYGPHSFQLMLSLTIFKFLTALVSCATAITLLTLIPLLLKVKVRELFLRQNVLELDQEVDMMKKQKEESWHARMLTREIRKSLDKHTILYTTEEFFEKYGLCISVNDQDVRQVINSKGVRILSPESPLAAASCGWSGDSGSVAAIRMPLLREMEIVEVVADQVAVALSHAAVLEESQLMREKLEERNRALQQAENALMASQARNSFQKVMSDGMRKPMHSIMGLLSIFQDENLGVEQRIIVDTMVKTSSVLSTLINDVMESSTKDSGRFPLETIPFKLHSLIREACCLARCVSVYKGFCLTIDVDNILPDHVISDEKKDFSSVTAYGWFSIESSDEGFRSDCSNLTTQLPGSRHNSNEITEGLSFRICKKLVQSYNFFSSSDLLIWIGLRRQKLIPLAVYTSPALEVQRVICDNLVHVNPVTHISHAVVFFYYDAGSSSCAAEEDDMNRIVSRMLFKKLDLHMAEMDGFEVAMRIASSSRNWPLIIAVTAGAEALVWERCLQVGMNGIIPEPLLLRGMEKSSRESCGETM
ncbi:hypothetical protein RJ641_020489 [Dillenia turbinata]|uniref:Signal transduction histidine kinase dimerisation/phosphoacceptor domain-containing protein n=1 Tax=Dillenia turbinata TaxID=194707 RepID=A0AAN8UTU8_9MAGN